MILSFLLSSIIVIPILWLSWWYLGAKSGHGTMSNQQYYKEQKKKNKSI